MNDSRSAGRFSLKGLSGAARRQPPARGDLAPDAARGGSPTPHRRMAACPAALGRRALRGGHAGVDGAVRAHGIGRPGRPSRRLAHGHRPDWPHAHEDDVLPRIGRFLGSGLPRQPLLGRADARGALWQAARRRCLLSMPATTSTRCAHPTSPGSTASSETPQRPGPSSARTAGWSHRRER